MKKSNSKFFSNFLKIEENILILLLIILTITVFLQVICRYVFKIPFLWGQEVAIFCFSWIVILSAANATINKEHFIIEYFLDKINPTGRKIVNLINYTLMLIYSILMLVKGLEYAIMGLKRASIYFEIPQFWTYISLPISGLIMIVFLIPFILNNLLLRKDPTLNKKGERNR